jgi:hypothetical protein
MAKKSNAPGVIMVLSLLPETPKPQMFFVAITAKHQLY